MKNKFITSAFIAASFGVVGLISKPAQAYSYQYSYQYSYSNYPSYYQPAPYPSYTYSHYYSNHYLYQNSDELSGLVQSNLNMVNSFYISSPTREYYSNYPYRPWASRPF